MNKKKLLARLMANQKNVKYNDFVALLKAFGFRIDRREGSHTIYKNINLPVRLNIQSKKGEAKPYQVEQFLAIIEKHDLSLDSEKETDEV